MLMSLVVINMKYKNYGSCLAVLGYQHVFSHKPSHLHIVNLYTYHRRRDGKEKGFKKSLIIISVHSINCLFFLIQLMPVECIIISDPKISCLF
jgi:hypothetical protein